MLPQHPLEIRYVEPFDFTLMKYGLLGVQANAFLAGALDSERAPYWYLYPLLQEWRCQFRREADQTLEAEWLGEWLSLLRVEGATRLRLHTERYAGDRQKYYPGESRDGGVVLSAWKPGRFGDDCLSSWTPVWEVPRARRERPASPGFAFAEGIPGDLVVDLFVRTRELLKGPRWFGAPSAEKVHARLDGLYEKAAAAGYALPELAVDRERRLARLLEALTGSAPEAPYRAMPALPRDECAEELWCLLLDAGALAGQLAQVPARVPQHPYDDENRGLIYPATDPQGRAYAAVSDGLRAVGLGWLQLCYRTWAAATPGQGEDRLRQRAPVDLVYLNVTAGKGEWLHWVKFGTAP